MSIKGTLNAIGSGIDKRYEAMMQLLTMLQVLGSEGIGDSLAMDNRAQAGNGIVQTVITVVVVGVVGVVGILIYSEIDQSIEVTGELNESATSLSDGFGSAMGLLPVVLIVLVASLVIIVIGGMRA